MAASGEYSGVDWTAKVDPDTVFFPAKLVERIHLMPVPLTGTFLQNCEGVKSGFFGKTSNNTKAVELMKRRNKH